MAVPRLRPMLSPFCLRARAAIPGSLLTLHWREGDSNPRSLPRLTPLRDCLFAFAESPFRRKDRPVSREGLAVRIHFPPAVSPSLRGPADAGGQSRGCGAGLGLVRDVRKGRAGYDQTSFGPVSLTGSEAFPLRARLIRGFSRSPSMPALASSRL
jgi:hypothetical protein